MPRADRDGKRLTWLMRCFERLFAGLDAISVGTWVRVPFDDKTPRGRRRAANAIDAYVCSWIAVEAALYAAAGSVAAELVAVIVAYRIVEIIQVYGNTLMFDELRHPTDTYGAYTMFSVSRTLVLMLMLLFETILLYGLLYYVVRDDITGIASASDALYLSIGTMSTGATYAHPHGWVRFLAASEVLFGFLFAVTILGRVVGLLPRIGDLSGQDLRASAAKSDAAEADDAGRD